MKQLKVGYLREEDQRTFIEWVNSTPNNLWDVDVLKYPTLRVICSYGDAPVAFLPVQQGLMLESLAVSATARDLDKGQAFRDLVKGAELHASSLGIRELYFVCRDPRVTSIAESHGFERIEHPLVRLKL